MDALAEAKQSIEKSVKQWASDGQHLLKSATALGVDTTDVVAGLTGRTRQVPVKTPTSRRTARKRTTATGNGTARQRKVTDEQIIAFLAEHPGATGARLAAQFRMSRTGIENRMKGLLARTAVSKEGTGWHAAGLTPA